MKGMFMEKSKFQVNINYNITSGNPEDASGHLYVTDRLELTAPNGLIDIGQHLQRFRDLAATIEREDQAAHDYVCAKGHPRLYDQAGGRYFPCETCSLPSITFAGWSSTSAVPEEAVEEEDEVVEVQLPERAPYLVGEPGCPALYECTGCGWWHRKLGNGMWFGPMAPYKILSSAGRKRTWSEMQKAFPGCVMRRIG